MMPTMPMPSRVPISGSDFARAGGDVDASDSGVLRKNALMPVQDDVRENQMIQFCNLTVPLDRSRADIDAHLVIHGRVVNFESKSTTLGSVHATFPYRSPER